LVLWGRGDQSECGEGQNEQGFREHIPPRNGGLQMKQTR
jgi:hypothetical protein